MESACDGIETESVRPVVTNPAEPGGSLPWMVRMAWRDSRGQRRKLMLFTLCVVFGMAALTAIRSFRHNLEVAVEKQSRSLLGADLRLSSLRTALVMGPMCSSSAAAR